MKISPERILLLWGDTLLIITGLYLSYLIRFDFMIPIDYLNQFYWLIPSLVAIRLMTMYYYRTYRIMLRFFSHHDLINFLKPFLFGTITLIFVNIFRNWYMTVFILAALGYLVYKKAEVVYFLERLKKIRYFNFPMAVLGIALLVMIYWLNLHYSTQLIPFKEELRQTIVFSNYPSSRSIPRTILITEFLINFILLSTTRIAYRYLIERKIMTMPPLKRILIYGVNRVGRRLVGELRQMIHDQGLELVGFIDDDPELWGKTVDGCLVWGAQENLVSLIERHKINQIIIAQPGFKGDKLERFIKNFTRKNLEIRLVPEEEEVEKNGLGFRMIRPIQIEDILDRKIQNTLEWTDSKFMATKVVLITGAGGSIGSELCRQIAGFSPRQIILLGKGENSIYHIHSELRSRFPGLVLTPIIADINDLARLSFLFNDYHPDLIFHTAAHKHVPMMEHNPGEALKNNFLGTCKLAQVADLYKTERFIFISTDKAVNPINMMGASKRLAELYLHSQFPDSSTRFIITRFGNVLGSRGSVVPLFINQIRLGGPITVTDKRVSRYFITIPEAVSLVLKSAEVGQKRDIFILDMGQQINILKLAENLIYLAGLRPYDDIPIVFSGLRPGEKLTEELATHQEGVSPTVFPGLFQSVPPKISKPEFLEFKDQIESYLATENISGCYDMIRSYIPTLKKTLHNPKP